MAQTQILNAAEVNKMGDPYDKHEFDDVCPFCGKDVSYETKICPHCAAKIKHKSRVE